MSNQRNAMAYLYCAREEVSRGELEKAFAEIGGALVFIGLMMGQQAAEAEVERLEKKIARYQQRLSKKPKARAKKSARGRK